jgi:hypothetical protein
VAARKSFLRADVHTTPHRLGKTLNAGCHWAPLVERNERGQPLPKTDNSAAAPAA